MRDSGIEITSEDDGSLKITVTDLGIATKNRHKSYTVFCPALKVLGYSARSERDALKDFEKNLTIFFGIHIGEDSLNEALISFNWTKNDAANLFGSVNNSPVLKTKNFNLSLRQAA